MNWLLRQTTTSLFAVSRTTALECAMVVQYGRWTAESSMIPDNDRSLRIRVGRNPRIMRSTMGSKITMSCHSRVYDGMSRFLSAKNVVIMICRSGRRRSVANAEWSNTLTRYGRLLHSIYLLHLSDLDFLKKKKKCAGNSSECSKESIRVFEAHYDCVRAECSRFASGTDSVAEHWKRSRRESLGQSCAGNKSLRATSAMITLGESNTIPGILDGLAERLGNFHASTCALADCLQTRDITRKTDQ